MDFKETLKIVLSIFKNNSFEAYLVGGCVRDFLLNKSIHDYDITTSASVDEIINLFKDKAKIIETGLKHGTVTIHINHYSFEITIYKGTSLKEDLLNRDLTINALAMDMEGNMYDFCKGKEDLKNKIIRVTNDLVFDKDPIRIIRCIRFSSILNFTIDAHTKKLMLAKKHLLKEVAVERINYEFSKILTSSNAAFYIDEYKEIVFEFMEELKPLVNFEQHNDYHIYDVWHHTLKVIENVSNNLLIRLVALFHDIGKPSTFTLDEKGGHFYGHHQASKEMASVILKRLKYDNDTITRCLKLIFYHDLYLNENKKSIKKILSKIGEEDIYFLYEIKRADILGQNPKYIERLKSIEKYFEITKEIIKEKDCFSKKDLAINGHDLIEIDYKGKQIKETLELILQKVIDEELANNKEVILSYLIKERN